VHNNTVKFYIAARTGRKEEVAALKSVIEKRGHSLAVDWMRHGNIKPYLENRGKAELHAIEDAQGARNCDVFILLSDEGGKGMYVELGIAIASHLETGKPKIYAVGEFNDSVIFFFHPAVMRKRTMQEVLSDFGEGFR